MKSFAKFLPSKYFRGVLLSLVILCILVGGSYALAERKNNAQSKSSDNSLKVTAAADNSLYKMAAEQDLDNDGLKDWEEILWQTDPKNPDSDGDGTNDGEEVKMGRNPSVPSPNDKLPVAPLTTPTKNSAASQALTPTDILARDFFSKYAEAKQGGQPLDNLTEQEIAASVLLHQNLIAEAKIYTESDISILKTNTSEALRVYGNEVGEIMKKTLTWDQEEIPIINSALENNNEKKLQELNPIINGYKSFLNQLLGVEVPPKAVTVHLSLINSVSRILSSLEGTKNVFKDPVSALVLFGKYPANITSLHGSFIEAKALFARNNVSFDPKKEAGYVYAIFADAVNSYNPQ